MTIQSLSGIGGLLQPGSAKNAAQAGGGDFAALLDSLSDTTKKNSKGLTTISSGVTAPQADQSTAPLSKSQEEVKKFMDYMNESTAEKFEDAWLARHHLTRDDLKNMSPQERKQIMAEIQQELKTSIEQQVEKKKDESAL